jgi:CheY-like chemotaxis protein
LPAADNSAASFSVTLLIEFANWTTKPPQGKHDNRNFGFEVDVSTGASTLRILCVDDRLSSLEVRRAVLTQAGYEVLIASDPASALAIFDEVQVDVVVLDYSFPGHISGEELAHQLRARKATLPLIMLTGAPDLPESAAASVDMLMLKGGGRPTDLLEAIATLMANERPVPDSSVQKSRAAGQSATASAARETPDEQPS